MLYYDRTNISEGTDLAKSNSSQEFMICHYLFFIMGSTFKILYAMGCHDYTIVSDIAIITVKMLISVLLFIALTNLQQLIH